MEPRDDADDQSSAQQQPGAQSAASGEYSTHDSTQAYLGDASLPPRPILSGQPQESVTLPAYAVIPSDPPQVGLSGSTSPRTATGRASGWGRRRWLFLGGIVVLLMALVGGGVAFAMNNDAAHVSATASLQPSTSTAPTKVKPAAIVYTVTQVNATDASAVSTTSGSPNGANAGTAPAPTVLATIMATDPNGDAITIDVTSVTVIRQGKNTVALSAILPGARIHVEGKKRQDGTIIAKRIAIVQAKHAAAPASGASTASSPTPTDTPNS